jgi:hypothetical protein
MRRTLLLPLLPLHGAVPYSYSRESVQSASDCRIQNAPPPFYAGDGDFAPGRSALLDRPRIPPHSSTRTERPPFFWLNLPKRSCCSESTGRWLVPNHYLSREKRWLLGLITKRYWSREKRWLLGLITKRYWSREKRWLLGLIIKRYWSREKRWLLGLITKRYWSREKRWLLGLITKRY